MFQRILVVFENEKVCMPAVRYAWELALRMDSEVTLLMVCEMVFPDRDYLDSKRNTIAEIRARVEKALRDLSASFRKEGIGVATVLRIGNPAEELLKFLAGTRPFQVLIWGSDESLPEKGRIRRKHWIGKILGSLECPILTVASREYGPHNKV